MNQAATTLLYSLGRTSVCLAVAAIVAFLLLRGLRCRSPALHRAAWCMVLLTGWLFVRATVTIPWYDAPPLARRMFPSPASEVLEVAPSGDPVPSALGSDPVPLGDLPVKIDEPRDIAGTALSWPIALAAVWLLGGAAVVAWWSIGYLRFVRQLPFGLPLTEEWQAEWREALAECAVRHPVRLCVNDALGPLVCRVGGEDRLLAPLALWRELSSQERRAILRHELAHVRRGDLVWSMAARCLALAHWFNPFCWWAVRNFDECGEWACDDAVHRRGPGDAVAYARVLLRIGQADPRPPLGAAIGGRRLSTRIKRMLTGAIPEDSTMKKSVLIGSVGVLALIGAVEWRLGARVAGAVDQEVEATRGRLNVDRTLLKKMVDDAAKAYEASKASYDVGTEVMSNVYVWSRRWLEAERALAQTDEEEIAALRAHRERMRRLFLLINAFYTAGTRGGETPKFFATKYYLAEADVWLAAAKNRGAEPAPIEKVPVSFDGPAGMVVKWDARGQGKFDSEPLVCPGLREFLEGQIYRLWITKIRNFGDLEVLGTLELVTAQDGALPVDITAVEVKRIVLHKTGMTKVIYRTKESKVETLTSEWEKPDDQLVAEAERRGEVLAILRLWQGPGTVARIGAP